MGFWEPLFFWLFTAGVVATSLGVLLFRNPLYAALSLVVDFFCFAGLYVLLSAHFLGLIQILVYTGAIMVLFVFIIMLLNLSDEELGERQFRVHHILAYVTGGGVFLFALAAIGPLVNQKKVDAALEAAETDAQKQAEADSEPLPPPQSFRVESRLPGLYAAVSEEVVHRDFRNEIQRWETGESTPADGEYRPYDPDREFEVPPALKPTETDRETDRAMFGTVEPISILLVNRYVVPFELIAVLLLAAIFGAVVIAKKRL